MEQSLPPKSPVPFENRSYTFVADLHLTVIWTTSGVSAITFAKPPAVARMQHSQLPYFVRNTLRLLQTYFRGIPTTFSEIPLNLVSGTPFERAVWRVCRTIPWGQTRPYAWIASQLAKPKASRAVGNALGKNPLPIVIPCHRVIHSDGTLGGFGHGLALKRRLLKLESPSSQDAQSHPPTGLPESFLAPF